MSYEISVTPAGHLLFGETEPEDGARAQSWSKSVAKAFASNQSEGLFVLGASKPDAFLAPSLAFWRQFAGLYLTELCKIPEGSFDSSTMIEPSDIADLEELLSRVPPMRGAEYLSFTIMLDIWRVLDEWIRQSISNSAGGLNDWLKKHAPLWHQVGRVCFHLAENKRDADYPFAFLATYAPKISAGGRVQYQPLSKALVEYAGEKNKSALINLLSPVQLASEKSNLIKELVETSDIFHPLMWTPAEAFRFLQEVPLFEESGVLVRLPDWWRKRPRPRVAITIGQKKKSELGMDALLDFKVDVTLGDNKLSSDELKEILRAQENLIFLKGEWIEVDRERLSQALKHWKQVEAEASDGISFIEGMRMIAGAPAGLASDNGVANGDREWAFVDAGDWLSDVLSRLRDPNRLDSKRLSADFKGSLRPYQQSGHEWLRFVSSLGLGACLADDMGLGKTVQVLSLLSSIKDEKTVQAKPSLLVLPASLMANWKAEMHRFAPSLKAFFVHPSELSPEELSKINSDPEAAFSGFDLVVTTYGMLVRQDSIVDVAWRLVILDEAQNIKNPGTNQTRAVKKLRAESRIALTGTPVENRLGDLWSLFDFLSPGLLGSADKFKRFVKALDSEEGRNYAPLRNLVSPYILRRLKTDKTIIADLPDKTEMNVFCGLAPQQAALYTRTVEELSVSLQVADGIKRRGLVLAYLLKFKQICNHPSQLLGDGEYKEDHSGKFERLRSICEEIASRQEKVLVFTQFREMTEPLAKFMRDIFGQPGLVLHGGTAVGKRQTLVDQFQQPEGPPFMVLSLKAGGTGLNLTAASHVVHFDRWWNPAVENQATDRAFRIGQHRNVLVHKFICKGTVEEKIDKMIAEKVELSDSILTGGAESVLTELSDKQLLDIVSLDIERVSID
ncbi:MAG TPA: DEAD/DEAH box helicase [Planktothrix sp.]|jgi:non-specific serine/threonine protein kinase